jgi:hypothetical protein
MREEEGTAYFKVFLARWIDGHPLQVLYSNHRLTEILKIFGTARTVSLKCCRCRKIEADS